MDRNSSRFNLPIGNYASDLYERLVRVPLVSVVNTARLYLECSGLNVSPTEGVRKAKIFTRAVIEGVVHL